MRGSAVYGWPVGDVDKARSARQTTRRTPKVCIPSPIPSVSTARCCALPSAVRPVRQCTGRPAVKQCHLDVSRSDCMVGQQQGGLTPSPSRTRSKSTTHRKPQFPNRCRLLAPAYDRTCLLACLFVGFLFWRQDCDARRAFRAITARLAWNLVSITNASGVPSDRQGSVHSTTLGVNEHPLSASVRGDRLRPR